MEQPEENMAEESASEQAEQASEGAIDGAGPEGDESEDAGAAGDEPEDESPGDEPEGPPAGDEMPLEPPGPAAPEGPQEEIHAPSAEKGVVLTGDARPPRVPWWPFEILGIAWLVLLIATVVTLSHEPDAPPALMQPAYPPLLLGAVVLTAAGPGLALITWLASWMANGNKGPWMLAMSLLKGALVTFLGVLLWWTAVTLVDAIRVGMVG